MPVPPAYGQVCVHTDLLKPLQDSLIPTDSAECGVLGLLYAPKQTVDFVSEQAPSKIPLRVVTHLVIPHQYHAKSLFPEDGADDTASGEVYVTE